MQILVPEEMYEEIRKESFRQKVSMSKYILFRLKQDVDWLKEKAQGVSVGPISKGGPTPQSSNAKVGLTKARGKLDGESYV